MDNILRGKNLYLQKVQQKDKEFMYPWFSDSDFLKYYDYVKPNPLSKDVVDEIFMEYEKKKSEIFSIKDLSDDKVIGVAGFDDIIKDNEVATLFIGFGEKKERGKGYGKETMKLLLNYGFKELNLHRIQLNVLEFNINAIHLYEKFGFKKEGAFREFVLRDNKRYDLLLYGLLKNEWECVENNLSS